MRVAAGACTRLNIAKLNIRVNTGVNIAKVEHQGEHSKRMASAVFVGVSTFLSPLNLTFVWTNIQISCYFLANSSAQGSSKFPQKVDDVLEEGEGTTGRDLNHPIVWQRDIIACFVFIT